MIIYIIILLLTFLLGIIINPNKNQKNKKTYLILVFGILFIVAAIRNYTVGVDTETYAKVYKIIKYMDFTQYTELRFEFGFFFFCKILNYISNNPQFLIAVTSFIITGAIGIYIYKNSKDVIMSSLIFITLEYYAMYLTAMRQAIAISILIFAYGELQKPNYIKYIVLVLLASLFHQSALIMLILLFFANKKFKLKYIYISIIVSIIGFFIINELFNILTNIFTVYRGYSQSIYFESNYFAALLNALVSLVILITGICCGYLKKDDEKDNLLAYIMCLNYIFYVITMKIVIFSRITAYFSFFSMIWLPNTVEKIHDKKQKMLVKYVIFVCTLIYWSIICIYRPEWHGVIPYKTFFW